MEVDYEDTCNEKIPLWKSWASNGRVQEAIDQLLALEKQTRTGADMPSTARILVAIVQICFEAKNWSALNDHIVLLSKRRSQLKQAVVKMVQECCTYVDKTPDKETKIKLIETLRTITEGKIYVEVERARLTNILAKIREQEGDVAEAAKIIQELQVETYGSMDKREKVELILEQMRLCLAIKDYIRTQIISKKINTKFFEEENTQELKEKFYRIMISVDQQNGQYLSVCRHFSALGVAGGSEALIGSVVFLILAPYDNEQSDWTHRLNLDKELDKLPEYKQLLGLFINPEIIRWNTLCSTYEKMLRKTPYFDASDEKGQERWNDLKNRVVEHNIRIMSMYYTRITLQRMSELLGLSVTETEEALSQLVVTGVVRAKIDRPAGVVHFSLNKDASDRLNDWSNNLNTLMQLVNKTTHLINKEECFINYVKKLLAVELGHSFDGTEHIHKHDSNLEQKYYLGDYPKAVDAVYFNGLSKNGPAVICGLARRPKNFCDAFLYLKVDGEDLLLSPNLPDTKLEQKALEQGEYSVHGITITNFTPMRTWKLCYSGEMKTRSSPERKLKVELELTWGANWAPFEYDAHMAPSSIASDMAREPWSSDYFRLLNKLHQTHYEQMGFIKGTAIVDGKEHILNMPCLRDRSFVICPMRRWNPQHDTRLTIGYMCIQEDQTVLPVDSSDFHLYQHGENQILPKDYGFVFNSGGQSYAVKIKVYDEHVFYIGSEREAKFYERWCNVEVNGVKGCACVEWHYNNVQNSD
ncbi:unnamed protein product, partial [Iphiclides podalirius]